MTVFSPAIVALFPDASGASVLVMTMTHSKSDGFSSKRHIEV